MDIELINQDILNYLKKYTRFMSKNIYITKKMYDNFVNSYEYIYENAESSIINYHNDKNYQKLLEIKDKGNYALKIHNKKYLDSLYDKYSNLLSSRLSKKEKLSILCEEDSIFITSKNIQHKIDIVSEKVFYLRNYCKAQKKDICIIASDDIKSKLLEIDACIYNEIEFENKLLPNNKTIISDKDKYEILSSYIKNILYLDKNSFKEFYKVFKDKLLFNKDCLDFETFNDYHSYMFKRKMISSKKNIHNYVKDMILHRRKNKRSISGNIYDNYYLIDIDNTLFCSGINYEYDKENSYFTIENNNISHKIYYLDKYDNNSKTDNNIYLYSYYKDGTNACEHLIYELVKRRYPIEKKSYEELYDIFKLDMIDSYFSRFIRELLIPYIDMISKNYDSYEEVSIIKDNLDNKVKEEYEILLKFYQYYSTYLEEHNLISKEKYIHDIKNHISNIPYKYLIILDDEIDNHIFKGNNKVKLFVLSNKDKFHNSYLMTNIKLFCDFKKYLNYHKIIPIIDAYYSYDEIDRNAYEFTTLNIDRVCNVYGDVLTNKKKVYVYIYDDSNRLKSDINSNYLLNYIISNIDKNKKIMIIGRDNHDRDMLTIGDYFSISNNQKVKSLIIDRKEIDYYTMDSNNIGNYDIGILIHPMDNKYGFHYNYMDEEVIRILSKNINYQYNWEKKLFYLAISRVKGQLYVAVPKSKASIFVSNIANHNEVMIKKEIFVYDKLNK